MRKKCKPLRFYSLQLNTEYLFFNKTFCFRWCIAFLGNVTFVCLEKLKDTYLVEDIRKHRLDPQGNIEYFVKWDGYPENENTWEPACTCACIYSAMLEIER